MFTSPFPARVCFAAVQESDAAVAALHPAELASLTGRESAARVRGFAAGRAAARLALAKLLPGGPLPVTVSSGRAPRWPEGVVGSIAHSSGWAVAAVDWRMRTRTIGIDLECLAVDVDLAIVRLVAQGEELDWIGMDGARLLTLFSAKESVFKALYPECGEHFDFDALRLTWCDARLPGFWVEVVKSPGARWPAGSRLYAGARFAAGFVLTWVCVEKS